jgi:hypothetical protein
MNTDIVIIGAGVVGCHLSYFLVKNNIKHILLEQEPSLFQNNASSTAGAFINPTIGKDSEIKSLMDDAFEFSTSFYTSLNKDIFTKEIISLVDNYNQQYETNIPHKYKKVKSYNKNGYLFYDAMLVNPMLLAKTLTKKTNIIYSYKVNTIKQKNNKWIINDNIIANKVILSSGYMPIIDEPYIQTRGLNGTKIDISTNINIPTAINYGIYFSKTTNNKCSIGATHHRLKNNTDTSLNKDKDYLINKIKDIVDIQDYSIVNIKNATRSCSYDYFPIVSEVIDSKKTLEKYPYIKNGTKIPEDKFILKKNLFICNGVGGRGFSLAPYISNILINHIINKQSINNKLTLHNRFIKYYRRMKD